MPEALDFLRHRRSSRIPELTTPGPSDAEIDQIITLAARVPDHGKLRPWRFIVFEGDGRVAASNKIGDIYAGDHPEATSDELAFEHARLTRAPLVIAVVSRAGPHVKIPEWEQVLSAGAAAMSVVLAAHALGYAAKWVTEWYAYDRRALDALGVQPTEKIAAFVYIGTPSVPAEDRDRPSLAEIATRYASE